MTTMNNILWSARNAQDAAWRYVRFGEDHQRDSFRTHVERVIDWSVQWYRYGFCEADLWDLKGTAALFLAPRLRKFAEWFGGRSIPPDMRMSERWVEAVNAMADAFDLVTHVDDWSEEWSEDANEKIQHGLKLFSEYFLDLWD